MRFYFFIIAFLSLYSSMVVASAEEANNIANPKHKAPSLNIGDPAPAFTVSEWLRGEEVKKLGNDKTYVVEFWATWCGPCVEAIPHLNKLQKKYQDKSVIFIGVSSEGDVEKLLEFLKIDEPKIEYRVAYDKFTDAKNDKSVKSGEMHEQWLNVAFGDEIPTAFVVNHAGRIAWIGHPNELDGPLKKIIDGKWDIQKARGDFLADLHRHQAVEDLRIKLIKAIENKSSVEAVQIIDEMVKIDPKESYLAPRRKFHSLLKLKAYDKVYAMEDELLAKYKDDEMILSAIAEDLIRIEPEKQNSDMALRFAYRAHKVANEEHPGNFFILAGIYFAKKDYDKAVEYQERAVEKLNPQAKEAQRHFKEVLQNYQAKKKEMNAKETSK